MLVVTKTKDLYSSVTLLRYIKMEQTQTLSDILESKLNIPREELSSYLREHSIEELDEKVADVQMRRKYKALGIDVEEGDSQETLDAKASVQTQRIGDMLMNLGVPPMAAMGYGLVIAAEGFASGIDQIDLYSPSAIGLAVIFGGGSALVATIAYVEAWKHYNQTSPELQQEIGRPWPLKMNAGILKDGVKETIFLSVSAAKGLYQGAKKAVQYISSKVNK